MKHPSKIKAGRKGELGFTLIELVISLTVVAIISVTVVPFFKVNLQSYLKARTGKVAIQTSRVAFNRIVNDVKQLKSPLDIWYASSSRMDVDVPNDGLAAITYRYDSGDDILYREGVKLAESVKSFSLSYFTSSGVQKSVPFAFESNVWRIQIDMSLGDDQYRINLREQIAPRNFQLQ